MPPSWHDFYILLGTASAALVALLFVAASIGASVLTPERAGATRTYLSPVVFHYSNILLLSLIALIPELEFTVFAVAIVAATAGSLIYSLYIFQRLFHDGIADLSDRLAYGTIPVVAYATGLVAGCLILAGHGPISLYMIAAASLLLLVVNIRNAWDLLIALARRATQEQRPKS